MATQIRQEQISGGIDGWIPANETWTYASADDPTYTFTISGDKTSKYSAGMRIKLTQTTVKYFIITKVAYSDPNTTITVYGGTDYDLANATITSPYYSMVKAPQGFPLSPAKWTQETKDTSSRTQASPTQNTWYNLGSVSLSIPIGVWDVSYDVNAYSVKTPAGQTNLMVSTTLSTANNSASDSDLTSYAQQFGAAGTVFMYFPLPQSRQKFLTLTSKTVYYLNTRTINSSLDSLGNANDVHTAIIRATCAYL